MPARECQPLVVRELVADLEAETFETGADRVLRYVSESWLVIRRGIRTVLGAGDFLRN